MSTISSALTCARASVGNYIKSDGSLISFAANALRYSDRGLLVEEARTNGVRNNTMVGGAAPSTLPTNWSQNGFASLTVTVVGTGQSNGIPYIDIHVVGTTADTLGQFNFDNVIPALNGQSWTESVWLAVTAGALTNITTVALQFNSYDASSVYIDTPLFSDKKSSLSSTLTRVEATAPTVSASTAYVGCFVTFQYSSGVAVNFTVRIGAPQMEVGASSSSPILTAGAASTRPLDLITFANLDWLDGETNTLYVEWTARNVNGSAIVAFNATNDKQLNETTGMSPRIADATTENTLAAGSTVRTAIRLSTNDVAISMNGGAVALDTSETQIGTASSVRLGCDLAGANALNGYIRRITCFKGIGKDDSSLAEISGLPTTLAWGKPGTTMVGLNCLSPFGYGVTSGGSYAANPYTNGGGDDATIMPDARLDSFLASGFDFVRMTIDPATLTTAGSDAILDGLIALLIAGINRRVARGLYVIADMHFIPVSPVAGWGSSDVIDGTAGTKFVRMLYCMSRFAAAIHANCDPVWVAMELFNEPPNAADFVSAPYTTQIKRYFDGVRAAMPSHTIIIGGTGSNAIDNFESGASVGTEGLVALTASQFDDNTSFIWHAYEPVALALQGAVGNYFRNVHRLTFPPGDHVGGKAQALTDLDTAIDADSTLDAAGKTAMKADFRNASYSFSYPSYFDTPQDADWVSGRYATALAWANTGTVASRRIGISEFGMRRDESGSNGNSDASFIAAVNAHVDAARANGIGFICIHQAEDGDGFGLTESTPPYAVRSVAQQGLRIS